MTSNGQLERIAALLAIAEIRAARIVDQARPARWVCFLRRREAFVWASERWLREEYPHAALEMDALTAALQEAGYDASWSPSDPRRIAERVATRKWPVKWYRRDVEHQGHCAAPPNVQIPPVAQ